MNCINVKNPEYIELLEKSKLDPIILQARISIFQDKNGLDTYPTLAQVTEGITKDKATSIQWLKDKLGMSDSEIQMVSGLVDGDAFGMFTDDGRILLAEGVGVDTAYHEAFHRVMNLYLSDRQKKDLLSEVKSRPSFREDYLRMKSIYNQEGVSEDDIVEEILAEEFSMYVMTDGAFTVPQLEQSLFDKIINFFRRLFDPKVSVKEVYDNIIEARYKGKPINYAYRNAKRKVELDGVILTEQEKREILGGIALYFNQAVFRNTKNLSNLYSESIAVTPILKGAKDYMLSNMVAAIEETNDPNLKQRLKAVLVAFNKDFLVKKGEKAVIANEIKDFFKSNYGITLNISVRGKDGDEQVSITDMSLEEEYSEIYDMINTEDKSEDDQKSRSGLDIRASVEFNTKDNLPKPIKLLLSSLSKRDLSDTIFGIEQPLEFNKVANLIINSLATVRPSIDNYINVLKSKIDVMPELSELLEMLGPETKDFIAQNSTLNEDRFYRAKLRNDFVQSFAKTKTKFLIQVLRDNDSLIIDTNVQQTLDKIRREWDSAFKQLLNKYSGVEEILQRMQDKSTKPRDKFGLLGITFSPEVSTSDISGYLDNIIGILSKMNPDVVRTMFTDKKSGLSGTIDKLASIELVHRNDVDLQQINSEGKQVYSISLNTYQSLLLDGINNYVDTIKDSEALEKTLRTEYPFLFNAYTKNSKWLEKLLSGVKLQHGLFDGSKIDGEEGEHLSQLSETDMYALVYNSLAKGYFMSMKHSDRSMYPVYNLSDKSQLVDGQSEDELIASATDIFTGYLEDEAARARVIATNPEYQDIQNLSKNGTSPLLFPYLSKEFSDIVGGKRITKEVQAKISKHLRETVEAELKNLDSWEVIKNKGVPNDRTALYKNILNAMVSHVEETKLFTGDLALYKNPDDFNKRLNTQSSTGQVLIVDEENNYYVNQMNSIPRIIVDGKKVPYQKFGLGSDSKGLATEFVIRDEVFVSRLRDTLEKILGKEYISAYENINENDGFSWTNMFFHREYEWRSSNWTLGKNKTFLGELNIFNGEESDIYVVPDDWEPEAYLKHLIESWSTQKPQYVGPNYGKDIDAYREDADDNRLGIIAGRKTAYMPLVPSVIQGTILEQVHKFMVYNGIDILHTEGAAKFGSKRMRNFYTKSEDSTQGFDESEIDIAEVGYLDLRYMKDQLKMNNTPKKKITSSTQGRKNITEGIIVKGKPINKELGQMVDEYQEVQSKIIKKSIEKLLHAIDAEPETLQLRNFRKFVDVLYRSALERNSSDNILDAIENWNFTPESKEFIETKPQYNKLQNILNSLITNRVLIEKRPGDMMAQVAITGMEPIGSTRRIINGKIESSDVLNFYTFNPDGSLNPAEIMMPLPTQWIRPLMIHYDTRDIKQIIDRLNKDIETGRVDNLVTFKGLRIPNQALSSNDVLKVKKFFVPTLHNAVFIPTELVAKVGSDFDIDKLSLYFPNPLLSKKYLGTISSEGEELENLQNRLLELEKDLILHPLRAKELFLPNGTKNIEEVAKLVLGKDKKQRQAEVTWTGLLTPSRFVDNNAAFVGGKQGVGIVATWITFLTTCQLNGLEVAPYYGSKNSTKLWFQGLTESYNLDNNVTIDKGLISEAYSELLTSQVDNVKDPVAVSLGIVLQTLNPLCYMILRGVPIKTAIRFLNVPAIRDFLKDQRINESQASVNSGNETPLNALKRQHLKKYSKEELDNVVITDAILKNPAGHEGFLLSQFFSIVDQAKEIGKVKNYLSPDTKYLKDMNSAKEINKLKREITATGIIPGFTRVFGANKLLSEFAKGRDLYYDLYKPLYLTEVESVVSALDSLKSELSMNVRGADNKIKMFNEVNNGFINYLLQNSYKEIDKSFESLFSGPNSLPKRILRAKDRRTKEGKRLGNNLVIQTFLPLLDNSKYKDLSIDNLAGLRNKFTTFETNTLTESFEEIKNVDVQLYRDLLVYNILQSGFSNSYLQMDKVIPYIDQQAILSEINKGLGKMTINMDDFARKFKIANPKYLPSISSSFDRPSDYYKDYNRVTRKLDVLDYDGNVIDPISDGVNYTLYARDIGAAPNPVSNIEPEPSPNKPVEDKDWREVDNDSQYGTCVK